MNWKVITLASAIAVISCGVAAKGPVVLTPEVASEPMEAMGYVNDAGVQTGLGVFQKDLSSRVGRLNGARQAKPLSCRNLLRLGDATSLPPPQVFVFC